LDPGRGPGQTPGRPGVYQAAPGAGDSVEGPAGEGQQADAVGAGKNEKRFGQKTTKLFFFVADEQWPVL
jgi:hypothetical protein